MVAHLVGEKWICIIIYWSNLGFYLPENKATEKGTGKCQKDQFPATAD